jgi:hypothetical protein
MDLKGKIIGELWGYGFSDLDDLTDRMLPIIQEHYEEAMRDAETYWIAEIDYHKARVEELEIDLIVEKNSMVKFPVPGARFETNVIKRKRRSNFK